MSAHGKLRAVVLAALVTGSVVAGVVSVAGTAAAAGNTLTVGGPSADYQSIGDAVDAAGPGDTIQVQPREGGYEESVVINESNLTIVGAPGEGVGAAANAPTVTGGEQVGSFVAPFTIAAGAENVSIRGFHFAGSESLDRGVVIDASNVDGVGTVANVTVTDNSFNASYGLVGLAAREGSVLRDVTVADNTFDQNAGGFAAYNRGVIDGLVVENNDVHVESEGNGFGFYALELDSELTGPAPESNADPQVLRNVTVRNNDIDFTSTDGARDALQITVHETSVGANLTVTGNELQRASTGLLLEGNGTYTDVDITDNRFNGSSDGIKTRPAGGNQEGPTDVTNVTVRNNVMVGLNNGIVHNGEGVFNASLNYWGAPDGPSGDYGGSGAAVVGQGEVTVEPYYVDEALTERSVPNLATGRHYPSLQAAVDGVAEGGTVRVPTDRTYDPVTVRTPGVTLTGAPGEGVGAASSAPTVAVTDGTAIGVTAANVTVEGLAVDATYTPAFEGTDSQAVRVTASNATIRDLDVAVAAESDAFEEFAGVQVFGGDGPIADVTVRRNDIEVTHTGPEGVTTGAVGVADQGAARGTVIAGNDVTVNASGYSYGVVTRASATPGVTATPNTTVVGNDIRASAGALNGVGYGIEGDGSDPGVEGSDADLVDATAQTLTGNDFEALDSLLVRNAAGTLDATGNHYGVPVESVAFNVDDAAQGADGDVVYDPYLTAPAEERSSTAGTTAFASDLTIPRDGNLHTVAFPGPVEGTVAEVIGGAEAGVVNVYAYNATTDSFETGAAIADDPVSAHDAFVVETDTASEPLRITVEYDDGSSGPAQPPATELDAGWNYVGAPQAGQAGNVFTLGEEVRSETLSLYGQPGSQPTPPGTGTVVVDDGDRVSPFEGYWVFVTEDATLPGTVYGGITLQDIEDALTED